MELWKCSDITTICFLFFLEKNHLANTYLTLTSSYVPWSLLLAPIRVGAQAFSWAAGKWETNRIGLPTSPSSSDVQNRVLQAAAKHESQPPDSEGIQDPSPEPTIQVNENVDLSEAWGWDSCCCTVLKFKHHILTLEWSWVLSPKFTWTSE